MISTLPATLIIILITICLKQMFSSEETYRKYSGIREIIFGLSMLLAAIMVPQLLHYYNLDIAFIVDGISYAVGFIILLAMNFNSFDHVENKTKKRLVRFLNLSAFKKKSTVIFFFKTCSSLILAGYIALIASLVK